MNDQTLKVIASNVNTTWNQEPEGEEWKKKKEQLREGQNSGAKLKGENENK